MYRVSYSEVRSTGAFLAITATGIATAIWVQLNLACSEVSER